MARTGRIMYARLGEACLKAGLKDPAMENFRKSIDLNPNNGIVAQELDAKETRAGNIPT